MNSSAPPTEPDTAHLVTGTLDTSGYGHGDLRDVALVYRSHPPEHTGDREPAPQDDVPGQDPSAAHETGTAQQPSQPPLFDSDGQPTEQALPEPGSGQRAAQARPAPVAQPPDADKERKAPPRRSGAKAAD